MLFQSEVDHWGAFSRVFFTNSEESFLIDDADIPILGAYEWRPIRFRPTCQYVARRGGGPTILLHREIMQPGKLQVDRRDGDGFNCRRYNLRNCTRAQNIASKHNFQVTGSGYRGVYASGKRWIAIISLNNYKRPLGTFDTPEQAARRWDAEAIKERGEFTQLNFPA